MRERITFQEESLREKLERPLFLSFTKWADALDAAIGAERFGNPDAERLGREANEAFQGVKASLLRIAEISGRYATTNLYHSGHLSERYRAAIPFFQDQLVMSFLDDQQKNGVGSKDIGSDLSEVSAPEGKIEFHGEREEEKIEGRFVRGLVGMLESEHALEDAMEHRRPWLVRAERETLEAAAGEFFLEAKAAALELAARAGGHETKRILFRSKHIPDELRAAVPEFETKLLESLLDDKRKKR